MALQQASCCSPLLSGSPPSLPCSTRKPHALSLWPVFHPHVLHIPHSTSLHSQCLCSCLPLSIYIYMYTHIHTHAPHIPWTLNDMCPMSLYLLTCAPCHHAFWSYVFPFPCPPSLASHMFAVLCHLVFLLTVFQVSYSVFLIWVPSSAPMTIAPVPLCPCGLVPVCCRSYASYSVGSMISVLCSRFQVPMSRVSPPLNPRPVSHVQ